MIIDYYYVVDKGSEVYKKYQDYKDVRDAIAQARHDYIHNQLNANDGYVYDDGPIDYLVFENQDDVPKGLSTRSGSPANAYYPNRRTNAGKDFEKKFKSFQFGEPDDAINLFNRDEFFAVESGRSRLCKVYLWMAKNGTLIAVVPTTEANPFTNNFDFLKEIYASQFSDLVHGKEKFVKVD